METSSPPSSPQRRGSVIPPTSGVAREAPRLRKGEPREQQEGSPVAASSPHPVTHNLGKHVKIGLTIAGVASTLLTTVFSVFHVDLFLRAYQLPLTTYRFGNFVYSIINTANDLAGAWLVDHVAMRRKRTDLVAISGLFFCACFLLPFFRWTEPGGWDGLHFVVSLSFYDTLYSFTAILLGSVVTDNHHMNDHDRVQLMVSGKVLNLVASFAAARIGLALFDTNDLSQFRVFLGVLAVVVGLLFVLGQGMILGYTTTTSARVHRWRKLWHLLWPPAPSQPLLHHDTPEELDVGADDEHDETVKKSDIPSRQLQWKRILYDFWCHKNFRAWIGMEMLLEAQMTFMNFFLKTFVDRLVHEHGGVSRVTCDWWISMIRPLCQMAAIGTYLPIRHFGYARVYRVVFVFNLLLSLAMLGLTDTSCTTCLLMYTLVYPVLTGAIQSAGFHLAMSDMVTELKRDHLLAGRFGEPSVAGMFMGINALLCKPMESLLPIVAATVLDRGGDPTQSLFYLLVVPPAACAVLQLASWSRYDLAPARTSRMRQELQELLRRRGDAAVHMSEEDEEMILAGTHEN